MKIVLIISLCLFFNLDAFAQIEPENKTAEISIEEISLARDDGSGKPGEITEKFLTTDRPIHCIIQLNSTDSATVKMIFVAVKANGLKRETKSISVSYKTNGDENGVTFKASPSGVWAAGDYRADVYINDKLVKSLTFKIEESATGAKKENTPAPKTFAPRKKISKPRKN